VGRDLSFEHPNYCFFATIRTICSRLWLINNPELEERILAYLARYVEHHGVVIYAFIIMGNHYHLLACFPNGNKAAFFRDFNGMISRLTKSRVKMFEGGKLWARRVRSQVVPNNEDIFDRFFYAALNPVAAGLVEKLSEYPSYNSFSDAIRGRVRTFKVVEWQKYNSQKRKRRNIAIAEFTKYHQLSFARLPGYESMTQRQYVNFMNEEAERRRVDLVRSRKESGSGFATAQKLKALEPGQKPRFTKTSTRDTHRPLVLTRCSETKRKFLDWYFGLFAEFRLAAAKFRAGAFNIPFPPGTYRPWSCCAC